MYPTARDAQVLLRAARDIHTERHGAHTFVMGTHLPLKDAALRSGSGRTIPATMNLSMIWSMKARLLRWAPAHATLREVSTT
jgi:hypothetical protein